jgi:hypothetical protein
MDSFGVLALMVHRLSHGANENQAEYQVKDNPVE